ncbi:hypothetical protein B7494_g4994 [Chlorociboria aeruginascens]|nr:hypothetical protein B7494_g4994 [Chlorociboria aeruginascens]
MGGPSHGLSASEWLLAPFQTSEIPTFTSHITTSLLLLLSLPSSRLIFTGSSTRPETELSEAQSYWNLCLDNDFWGLLGTDGEEKERVKKRVLLEEKALDSLGNLVLSVVAFWKETGSWPRGITLVSHGFKERRFLELHVKALRWRREVKFVGVDPGYMVPESAHWDGERAEEVRRGERERGYEVWEKDLWGRGRALRGKRKMRDCWGRGLGMLFESEEEKKRSGVRSEVVEGEEILLDERQPWEDEL